MLTLQNNFSMFFAGDVMELKNIYVFLLKGKDICSIVSSLESTGLVLGMFK